MKVAYHFKVSPTKALYGPDLIREVFSQLLQLRGHAVNSKILIGDLLIQDAITPENHGAVLSVLLQLEQQTWKKFSAEKMHHLIRDIVFIVCFESISKDTASALHFNLEKHQDYLGAYEINDGDPYHWIWYGERIGPHFRIVNKNLYYLFQSEETMPEESLLDLDGLGFKKIENEFTGMRYSIFDSNHNFESARRVAEWKNQASDILGTAIDNIVANMFDAAPDLGNRLWTMLDTYRSAETTEKYAQVMATCRRTFEYVIDCIFPPTDIVIEGHSLKKDKYKNRLYQFAAESTRSDTNIELIVASTDLLFQQWDKLNKLANKGVHSDVFREETRRCVIRTLLLLDDIVSLHGEPFEIKSVLDDTFEDIVNRHKSS